MVRTYHKSAFTLIELIFAIVVISIVIISLPMMSQVTNKNIEKGFAQEGILIASAELIKAISGKWDENSKPDGYNFEYVMYVDDAERDAAVADGNMSRIGNVRILYTSDNTLRPSLGIDGETTDTFDDVDDYAGNLDLTAASGSEEGYKFSYKKNVTVTNSEKFGDLNNSKNLKKVTIMIKDSSNTDLVQLYMYVANTGSANSLSRTLP